MDFDVKKIQSVRRVGDSSAKYKHVEHKDTTIVNGIIPTVSKEKIVLDVDSYDDYGVAIICAPTGIICKAQTGGVACSHSKTEGFPINIKLITEDETSDFDDCKWGCFGGKKNDEYREKYGQAIDDFLLNNINGNNYSGLRFEFDPERKEELTEGWWPVLIQFKREWYHASCNGLPASDAPTEFYNTKFKGYLHLGNCD